MTWRGPEADDNATAKSRSKAGPTGRRRVISAAIALFAVVFIGWGYSYLQSPAEGVVVKPSGPPPQTEAASTAAVAGKTFTIELPGEYNRRDVEKPTPPTMELFNFTARKQAFGSHNIGITIKKSPPSALGEESALVFRQRSPEYTSRAEEVAGKQAIKMTKADGSEITYFVPGPNAYAIIATTTTSPGDTYAREINQIIKSFRWK